MPTIEHTEFDLVGETCELRHRGEEGGGVLLHFATHVPGATKGVSPRARGEVASDLAEVGPPRDSEFTEKEIAIVATDRAVAFVGAGAVRDKTVERALRGLIHLHHGPEIANQLVLQARADEELVNRLLEEGVTYLDLGLSLPHVDAEAVRDGQPRGLVDRVTGALAQALSARLHDDLSPAEIEALATADSRLIMDIGKRAPLQLMTGLADVAKEAIASDDEFTLKTASGAKYSREQLLLTQRYSQRGSSFLDYRLAWTQSLDFLRRIE